MSSINIPGVGVINHGDLVSGTIAGTPVDGRINISSFGKIYFCQNKEQGDYPDNNNTFGYNYGWSFQIRSDGSPSDSVKITKNLSSQKSEPIPDTPFLNTSVGRIHHGDKVKVMVDAYKPGIYFKCHLVIHAGQYFLNTNAVKNGEYYGVPKIEGYKSLFKFSPGQSGIKFKEIVERAPIYAPPVPKVEDVRSYPAAKSEAYISSEDLNYKPVIKSAYDSAVSYERPAKPASSESQRITIRRRKPLRLNQNL